MGALLMDLAVVGYMVFLAISERGTFAGWLGTICVIGYTFYVTMMFRRQS